MNLLFISSYTGLGGGERIQLNLMEALDRQRYRPASRRARRWAVRPRGA